PTICSAADPPRQALNHSLCSNRTRELSWGMDRGRRETGRGEGRWVEEQMGTGGSSSSHRRRTSKLLKKHIMAGSPGLDFVYELLAMTARGEEEDEAMWGHI
ncbi:unnamed protein product, partial [Musa acuminata subsp. burmannicoides]